VPFAIVVPASDADVDEPLLLNYVRDRIAHYKCPAGVEVVAALPRNTQGKVLKRELRAALTAQ
jgi:acyl-CoA synthetase (AMP-forming)/AMP-acid ligase II